MTGAWSRSTRLSASRGSSEGSNSGRRSKGVWVRVTGGMVIGDVRKLKGLSSVFEDCVLNKNVAFGSLFDLLLRN